MKKLFLSSVLAFTISGLSAAILTLSNAAHLPAQYATFQSAHDDASPGDTILVSATGMSYGVATLTKQLSIIGSNFMPGQAAQFDVVYFGNSACDGSLLQSLYIGSVQIPSGLTITNFSNHTIRRCYLGSIYVTTEPSTNANHFYNWLIEGCVFYSAGSAWNMNTSYGYSRFENFTLRNNIFNGVPLDLKYALLENNIFLGTDPGSSVINGFEYSTISNNIFYGKSVNGGTANTYINNITYGASTNSFSIPANQSDYPYNTGSNNLIDTNPNFVNASTGIAFDPNADYHLQPGSPAIGAGADGQDCGVYDGSGIYREDGEPDIPVVRSVVIPGGNIVPAESSFEITVHSVSHE